MGTAVEFHFDMKRRLREGIPKAVFYLGLFYVLAILFTPDYGFVASVTGVAFDNHYQRKLTPGHIAVVVCLQLFVCALAVVACRHIALRLALNLVFPFLWVCLFSSPFNRKGYYVGMITFVFMQLIPVEWSGISHLLAAVAVANMILALVLSILCLRQQNKQMDYTAIQRGLESLSRCLCQRGTQEELLNAQDTLYKMAYDGNNILHARQGQENICYLFALVFQRAAYYFADAEGGVEPDEQMLRQRLSDFFDRVAQELNETDNTGLIHQAAGLVADAKNSRTRFGTFCRNALRLTAMALKEMSEVPGQRTRFSLQRWFSEFRFHLQRNTFEMRFAFRLSLVTFLSFLLIYLLGSEHAYWIAVHAFIIIQPSYEESLARTRARLIGSLIGCLTVWGAYALFPSQAAMYVYFSVVIVIMYLATPGTWVHPIFATNAAVSLACITLGSGAAIEYRLLYFAMAAVLVVTANRFVFPSTKEKKFADGLRKLYRMQSVYLSIMMSALHHTAHLTVLRSVLIRFHMLRNELNVHLAEYCPAQQADLYRSCLLLFWRIAAEAEQMIILLQTEDLSKDEQDKVRRYIQELEALLSGKQGDRGDQRALAPSLPFFDDLAQCYRKNLQKGYSMITLNWSETTE